MTTALCQPDAGSAMLAAADQRQAACVYGLAPTLPYGPCWCTEHWPAKGGSLSALHCARVLARLWAVAHDRYVTLNADSAVRGGFPVYLTDLETALGRQLPELDAAVLPMLTELVEGGLCFEDALRVVAALPGSGP